MVTITKARFNDQGRSIYVHHLKYLAFVEPWNEQVKNDKINKAEIVTIKEWYP